MRSLRQRIWFTALAIAGVVVAIPAERARGTYSIVAVDVDTDRVGGAGTSCVGSLGVEVIYGSVPGVGAVHAQANLNMAGRDEAVQLLGLGTSPDNIIAAITDPLFDGSASTRQYGVVDLQGRSAGWTGVNNGVYANDVQGSIDTFTYSVQGNILTGQQVLDQAETAFRDDGCDLADRLMLALEAGAQGGHGDSRCTGSGIPSDSAFIQVDLPGGTALLFLTVSDTAPASPLPLLRSDFDEWRAQNPCPGTGPDAGVPDAGVADAGPRDSGAQPTADASPDPDGSTSSGDSGGGCNCRSDGSRGATIPLGLLLITLWIGWRSRQYQTRVQP